MSRKIIDTVLVRREPINQARLSAAKVMLLAGTLVLAAQTLGYRHSHGFGDLMAQVGFVWLLFGEFYFWKSHRVRYPIPVVSMILVAAFTYGARVPALLVLFGFGLIEVLRLSLAGFSGRR